MQLILVTLLYPPMHGKTLGYPRGEEPGVAGDPNEEDDDAALFDISYRDNIVGDKVNLETFLEIILNTAKVAEDGVEVVPNLGVKNKNIGDLSSWLFYPGIRYSFLSSPAGRWRHSGSSRRRLGEEEGEYQAVVLQIPNI